MGETVQGEARDLKGFGVSSLGLILHARLVGCHSEQANAR